MSAAAGQDLITGTPLSARERALYAGMAAFSLATTVIGSGIFTEQTRRAQLADEEALGGMTEGQRRLYVRGQLRDHNKQLAATASVAGVVTAKDFAIFQDWGYRGLYAGETARDIAARKGVKPGTILDHMGGEELAANLFRATQADAKLQREGITGKDAANATLHAVGQEVRATISRLGGTMPEDLPTPATCIQQVERAERERLERERQPSLFEALPALSDDTQD